MSGVQISNLPQVQQPFTGTEEFPCTQGSTGPLTGTTRRATLNQVANAIIPPAYAQFYWPANATVAAGIYVALFRAPSPGVVQSVDTFTGSGSFVVEVFINGNPVGGLTGINVTNASLTNTVAGAGNSFAVGAEITFAISSVSGSPGAALVGLTLDFT